jgi:fatty-acyl-CoA synthase
MSACGGSRAGAIYEAIAREGVTHLCGAPVVMNMLLNAGRY